MLLLSVSTWSPRALLFGTAGVTPPQKPVYSARPLARIYLRVIDLDSNSGDSNVTEHSRNEVEAGEGTPSAGKFVTPQGTMGIVLIYLAAMAALWGYVYVILLRSQGFWSGLFGRS